MLATLIPFVVMFNIIPITVIGMIMTERNLKNDPALEKIQCLWYRQKVILQIFGYG